MERKNEAEAIWFAPHCTADQNAGFSLGGKTDNPDNSNAYLNSILNM